MGWTLDDLDLLRPFDDIETLHMDRGDDFAFVRDDCTDRRAGLPAGPG